MSLTSGNAEMQENSDSNDENDDDIPLANLFDIRNRLDQIGFTMHVLRMIIILCEFIILMGEDFISW
jgi:hypothetical protein